MYEILQIVELEYKDKFRCFTCEEKFAAYNICLNVKPVKGMHSCDYFVCKDCLRQLKREFANIEID